MTRRVKKVDPTAPIVVIDIGNTSIDLGTWRDKQIEAPLSFPTDDQAAFDEAFDAHLKSFSDSGTPPVVAIGSVVPSVLDRLSKQISENIDRNVLVVGDTIPLPMQIGVRDESEIGVDRVCVAAAAYDRFERACTVVDFGTAVTVDLVSQEGELLGGAILPGAKLQLASLHEHTAQLPKVEPAIPELPFGRSTQEAMQTGVCRGLAGAVRSLVEAYATHMNQWPYVVATGGNLPLILPHCDFIDTNVPFLTLAGIGLAYDEYMASAGL